MASFFNISIGAGARAFGDFSLAVGDGMEAKGADSLSVGPLEPKMNAEQTTQALLFLAQVLTVHSALGPSHKPHVEALQNAIHQLSLYGRGLSAIARHEAQLAAQSASKPADDPAPLPQKEKMTADSR